jgi:hypothetical protein
LGICFSQIQQFLSSVMADEYFPALLNLNMQVSKGENKLANPDMPLS